MRCDGLSIVFQGQRILRDLFASFDSLPNDADVKKTCQWDGKQLGNWMDLYDSVSTSGAPALDHNERFSMSVYGLPHEDPSTQLVVKAMTGSPTFVGKAHAI